MKCPLYFAHSNTFETGELVYTSKHPFIDHERFLAYHVPIGFTSQLGMKIKTGILLDPVTGQIITLIPPPPG